MTEVPIIAKSPLPYQIAIFIVIQIWALIINAPGARTLCLEIEGSSSAT